MKIHELTLSPAKEQKRVGRGIGSGKGKTAGRGTKGQNSRSGGGVRPGFEGGQNPLAKRIPKKRGFQSINRIVYQNIDLSQLAKLSTAVISNDSLIKADLVKKAHLPVKVLGTGDLNKKKLTVKLQSASASAQAAIVGAGGQFEATPLVKFPKKPARRRRQ